jgi:hypothetical protein
VVLGFELRAHTLSYSTSPFLSWVFFEIRAGELFVPGWLQTAILLISASCVARIIGIQQHPAVLSVLITLITTRFCAHLWVGGLERAFSHSVSTESNWANWGRLEMEKGQMIKDRHV